jgi:hypothetical protein
MKKTATVILCLLLAAALALSLAACGEKEETVATKEPIPKKDPVSQYKAEGFEKSTLKNQVSWEGINQFKTATEIAKIYETDKDTAIAEARKSVVDFFNYAKTATWIPAETWEFYHTETSAEMDVMTAGQVYGGLPYVGMAASAIYRLMDFIDEETGVVDIYSAGGPNHEWQKMFGNQCANGAYVGWARVINSCDYGVTADALAKNKYIKLGSYTYDENVSKWSENYNTTKVIEDNDANDMFESYALLKAGDGIVQWTTAGHIVMIAKDAHVERTPEGKIDPSKSYVYIIDQAKAWVPYQHQGGDTVQVPENVDAKWTFTKLLSSVYLPFTYLEWLGEDPIEETEVTYSHTGETITIDQLFSSKVTTNYYLFDIYAQIFSSNGSEVCKIAVRSEAANTRELAFKENVFALDVWGSYEDLDPNETYTVKVYAQLGTGERPALWEGKLVQ